jgi:hypothetical protein
MDGNYSQLNLTFPPCISAGYHNYKIIKLRNISFFIQTIYIHCVIARLDFFVS